VLDLVQEAVDVVFVKSFQLGRLERPGPVVELLLVEQPQHPPVQDQFLVEAERLRLVN
jgi:hypothetical protein